MTRPQSTSRTPFRRRECCALDGRTKNWSKRRLEGQAEWRCKSRLVIAGHTDPDLASGRSGQVGYRRPDAFEAWTALFATTPGERAQAT